MPQFVDTPPAGADAWREVWQDDRRYRPRPAKFEWLFRFVRRLVSRANEQEAERQKNFNVVLIDLLADLHREIAALRSDLKADLAAVQSDVRRADEALAADVAQVRELIPVAARRNDALIAALDQKIESVAARLRDLTNPFLERAPEAVRNDFLYRRLEDGMRGSEAEVRASVAPYVELAKTHAPLIDVGCGRGELLDLLRSRGVKARGIDVNRAMVDVCRERGLDAEQADAVSYLERQADGSVGGLVAIQVVEHFEPAYLLRFLETAHHAMKPGAPLVLETINPACWMAFFETYIRDLTHQRPLHPDTLRYLVQASGFTSVDVQFRAPVTEGDRLERVASDPSIAAQPALGRLAAVVNAHADKLNARLFSSMDYVVIARR
jgi:O-antigen chain-terminating methyltransferase